MPLFWKPYTSDLTDFIAELKKERPTLEAEQRSGRAILWDRSLNRDEQGEFQAARVAPPSYAYQTKTKK